MKSFSVTFPCPLTRQVSMYYSTKIVEILQFIFLAFLSTLSTCISEKSIDFTQLLYIFSTTCSLTFFNYENNDLNIGTLPITTFDSDDRGNLEPNLPGSLYCKAFFYISPLVHPPITTNGTNYQIDTGQDWDYNSWMDPR